MYIFVDMQSEIPIYIQLKNQIVEGIATQTLAPGDPLPSVRQMASDLGINLHTVNKVYTLLKQEGFLTVHRKSGVVVNTPGACKATPEFLKKLEADLKPVIAEVICRSVDRDEFLRYCHQVYDGMVQARNGGKNV